MRYLLFASIIFCSCSIKKLPLKNKYPNTPFIFQSDRPVDSVWSTLIDFISQKGISIKIIDKSSSLLITEDYNFDERIAFEKKNGALSDSSAFIVTSLIKSPYEYKPIGPDEVLANWNVRLKSSGSGTAINVNLTNIRSYDFEKQRYITNKRPGIYEIKSTGVFENMIYRNIK